MFAKRDGKEIAANIVLVILGACCMVNVKMEAAFAKQASMEGIARFRLVLLWACDKGKYVTAMAHVS